MKNLNRTSAFTLLELVVVLAILAIVTALALRAVDRVEDQKRYEASQRGMEEIETAILGSSKDEAADGSRTLSGFVADMGRLPQTVGTTSLSLAELWQPTGAAFDARPAIVANGVLVGDQDPQVLVPGGWRGPYLRLPTGGDTILRDAWGNAYVSPADASPPEPLTTGYARLRDGNDLAITTAGQAIRIIRHLGANGRADVADTGYDRDIALSISDDRFQAELKGTVEIRDGDDAAEIDTPLPALPADRDKVIVRVFGPDPSNPALIKVWPAVVDFSTNPATWTIPLGDGVTIGPRVVRAYFVDTNLSGNTTYRKSAVRNVTLRPGVNVVNLIIDRP